MKRIALMIFLGIVLICAFSGFKPADLSAVEIRECTLTSEEVRLHIYPGPFYKPHSVVLNVKVSDEAAATAIGSRKIELLSVPAEGIIFRVPLSRQLKPMRTYNVAVDIDSTAAPLSKSEWKNVIVSNKFSGSFFDKNFKPIIEPAELRNQINIASIRKQIN